MWDQVVRDLGNVHTAADYIDERFRIYVNDIVKDPEASARTLGCEEALWASLDRCFTTLQNPRHQWPVRYTNALLMVCVSCVASERASELCWTTSVPEQVCHLLNRLTSSLEPDQLARPVRFALTFVANLSRVSNHKLEKLLPSLDPSLPVICQMLADPQTSLVVVSIMENSARHCSAPEFWAPVQLLEAVLTLAFDWFEHDSACGPVLISWAGLLITNGLGRSLLGMALSPESHLCILKLVDACLEAEKSRATILAEPMAEEVDRVVARATPFVLTADQPTAQNMVQGVTVVWQSLLTVLECVFQLCCEPRGKEAFLRTGTVAVMVRLLVDCEKHLPKRSRLKDVADPNAEPDPAHFPRVKAAIIDVIGALAEGCAAVQDQVRELHGLEVVLSNCIIDLNNPFVKEKSIVCIRTLLTENKANQEFVARLEAKEAVSEEAIEAAGFETEIVNGKIALKHKPQ